MEAVIFVGIQAAGKSTFYRERFFTTHMRISLDLLRTRHRERSLLAWCIAHRQRFVVDTTNPSVAERAVYIVPARAAGFRVMGYVFEANVPASITRNAGRAQAEQVPVQAIGGTKKRDVLSSETFGFAYALMATLTSGGVAVPLRIVVMSDTHGLHERIAVPDGDVLIHAGDMTGHGTLEDLRAFNAWLGGLPHRHKLVIAGNHDWICAEVPEFVPQILDHATYLCDSGVTIGSISFYGSPWQPRFLTWAFNLDRMQLRQVWSHVPSGVDVLITHTPPAGILDRTMLGSAAGCTELRSALPRIRPRLHVFGHIHEGYGRAQQDGTTFANASCCTLNYRPINPLLVFDLE